MQNKHTILQNWTKEKVSMNEIIDNIFYLINLDNMEMKRNIVEISRNTTHQNPSEKWFYALKIISIYSVKNKEFFSQSQLYDLLTIMSRIMDERKKDVVNKLKKILSFEIESNSIQDIRESEIFEILEKLTKRNEKEIQNSFQSLIEPDKQKIENICRNYHKLQEYSQLMFTHGFSELIEKEAGRKLSESQIQHAANSIKKTKTYLESILDGSFVPKGKHGINHVKHKLEYGFQLMGIIQSKRRKIIIDNNTSKVN